MPYIPRFGTGSCLVAELCPKGVFSGILCRSPFPPALHTRCWPAFIYVELCFSLRLMPIFSEKVTRQFRMYTYRIRGKRGPFKIILPASFCSFLTLPGMSGSPPSFSDYQYFYSFMDRNVHAHFYRQSDHYWRYPLNERILSGIVHFLFFGKIMQKQVLYFSWFSESVW